MQTRTEETNKKEKECFGNEPKIKKKTVLLCINCDVVTLCARVYVVLCVCGHPQFNINDRLFLAYFFRTVLVRRL